MGPIGLGRSAGRAVPHDHPRDPCRRSGFRLLHGRKGGTRCSILPFREPVLEGAARPFRAGDVITFDGDATDIDDGTLPVSAYTWNIDFLHEGHVHPGTLITGVKSGTFTISTDGHDFSGNTRYRITSSSSIRGLRGRGS
jgi:hypothetical protein